MLSKKYRFHSRGGVRYTYKNGKPLRQSKISLVYAANSRGRTRFAVVVSKKILKSAVGRNRIRRRIYEAIRGELQNIKKPTDCIFTVYSKDLKDMPFSELQKTISELLEQAHLKWYNKPNIYARNPIHYVWTDWYDYS